MATIDRRPNGKWRAQVRREGHLLSKTFVMKGDADAWVRDAERSIGEGEDPAARRISADAAFGSLIDQHIDDLTTHGKRLRRSNDGALARLKRELGDEPLSKLTRERLVYARHCRTNPARPATRVSRYCRAQLHFFPLTVSASEGAAVPLKRPVDPEPVEASLLDYDNRKNPTGARPSLLLQVSELLKQPRQITSGDGMPGHLLTAARR